MKYAHILKYGLSGQKAGVQRQTANDVPVPPASPMTAVKPKKPEFAKQPSAPKAAPDIFAPVKPHKNYRTLNGLVTPRQNDNDPLKKIKV